MRPVGSLARDRLWAPPYARLIPVCKTLQTSSHPVRIGALGIESETEVGTPADGLGAPLDVRGVAEPQYSSSIHKGMMSGLSGRLDRPSTGTPFEEVCARILSRRPAVMLSSLDPISNAWDPCLLLILRLFSHLLP